MGQVSVAIVDANATEGERLSAFLAEHGFAADLHRDGEALLGRLPMGAPQAVLLAIPPQGSKHALGLLRRVRERWRLPLVAIGGVEDASAEDISQVLLLEAGADDVLPRGLPLRVLLARLRAILRRGEWGLVPGASRGLAVDGWRLIVERRQLLRPDGSECVLTTAEFDLMQLLLENRGRAVSRDTIAAVVFRRPFRAEDRTVDNLVLRLRRKLGCGQQEAVKTVRGAGYMFIGFSEDDLRVA